MDVIHAFEIDSIHFLQEKFQDKADLMLTLSHLGDPRNAFLIYFPLAYCLHRPTGIQVLWLASVTEWINAILKWILHGDRPYWWVAKSGIYNANDTVIQQYHLTCETGPGSPSGHAMVTASVVFCLVTSVLQQCRHSCVKRYSIWLMFVVFLLAVNVSRVFIATHFPHQVVLGTITGIAMTLTAKNVAFNTANLRTCVLISMAMPLTCILTFYLFKWIGLDPQWSITMATKHCAREEWIHLDTTLFNAVYRDAGSVFGLGIYHYFASSINNKTESTVTDDNSRSSPQPYLIRLVHVILAVYLCQLGENVKPVQTNPMFYYFFTFVKFAILVILVKTVTNVFTVRGRERNLNEDKLD